MRIIVFLTCLSLALAFNPRRLSNIPARLRSMIVGGDESPVGSRPYQVALFFIPEGGYDSQYCGGTLVHPNWVVSAAHCAFDGDVWVGLGYHNLDETDKQIIKGTWIVNKRFNDTTLDYDVALIQLETPATLSDIVRPIGIAAADSDVAAGTSLLVSGWGSIASGGAYPMELRQVVVQAISRAECKADYPPGEITNKMICAKAEDKDSCQGDSGGPIVSNFDKDSDQDGVTLEGIVSWGYGCADSSYPGVYTRVAKFCQWIAHKTSSDVTCLTTSK